MLDNVVVVNEIILHAKARKRSSFIFKLDFEKAYENVRWPILYYMMKHLGFCDTWIHWMKGCVESSTMLILVNGCPSSEFKNYRGLR